VDDSQPDAKTSKGLDDDQLFICNKFVLLPSPLGLIGKMPQLMRPTRGKRKKVTSVNDVNYFSLTNMLDISLLSNWDCVTDVTDINMKPILDPKAVIFRSDRRNGGITKSEITVTVPTL
jgi:hypothetical protein